MTFRQLCVALFEGRITFNQFAQLTRPKWRGYAKYLAQRWRQPTWHAIEDIEQELLSAAWESIWKFDPHRKGGASIDRFLVYNALDGAKKACHHARGSKLSRCQDRNPSRIEFPFSAYEDEEALFEGLVEPDQELGILRREAIALACAYCSSAESEAAMRLFFAEESVSAAAARLFEDRVMRESCRFESAHHAEVFVRRTVVDVVAQLHAA